MNKKVSIIIPVFNGSNYLSEAIDSALNQDYENCEVIVVNDGSDDNGKTKEIALSYGSKIVYLEKENGGVASALNLGIRKMTGEYFSWLSHDDIYYRDKISEQIRALEHAKDATKIVQCEYDLYEESTGGLTSTNFSEVYGEKRVTNSVFSLLQFQVHACTALIHKSHFERVGLFDEKLLYTQDIEFWFRLLRGQSSLWVPKSLIRVRVHKESGTNTKHREWNVENIKMNYDMTVTLNETELSEMFGSFENGICRMTGLLLSRDAKKEATSLEKLLKDRLDQTLVSKDSMFGKYLEKMFPGSERKIILFGAGMYGIRMLYELESRGVVVSGFMDNDSNKIGEKVFGKLCNTPEFYANNQDEYIVIITQKLFADALKQLKQIGFENITTRQDLDGVLLDYNPVCIPLIEM